MGSMHPIQRRLLAEDLVRIRPPGERRRYVASQRSGKIDPNPHQIDAVIFALNRIPEGGCILADEVGLGKTIEAGLVIAQMRAEGAERILLITPKALLGQWRQELFTLFSITAKEYDADVGLDGSGVFLVTRDFAGSESGASALGSVPPFDLCVIDEAHEVFAGIHRRFDRSGTYQADSKHARIAGRVKALLTHTPVLLLTATPIQNSLTELWGLVQFVEPTGTLLGNLATFRKLFCGVDDRILAKGQEHELQTRIAEVCQRTLRRQAQEFMSRPFVGRRTQLFEYSMSSEERELYDDITAYLLQPGICAFRGSHRRLLLIGFHRRMASSIPALAASLEKVAERLEKMLRAPDANDGKEAADNLLDDLEEDERTQEDDVDDSTPPPREQVEAEIARVRSFIDRANSLPSDAKAQALVRAVRMVMERAKEGHQPAKVVVFTESLTTQNYLRRVLIESGLLTDQDITLFRGTNTGKRVDEAVQHWRKEELAHLPKSAHPTKDIATRLALVHEFATRSKVFISTEAGAKGLNLQFAGTLINYDLPWNPQRIEQRIGRIHRYGQSKDVLVINFVASDNEAQKLTLEILTQKLELFGTVLGASDEVLHETSTSSPEPLVGALGAGFETRLRRIYERARSQDEIEAELVALREAMEEDRESFEDIRNRTSGLIETRFDDQVKRVFRDIQTSLSDDLAEFDTDLEEVIESFLDAAGIEYERMEIEGAVQLKIAPSDKLPGGFRDGFLCHIGDPRNAGDADPLHLGHPLVLAALEEARASSRANHSIRADPADGLPPGTRGKVRLLKVSHLGYEAYDEIIPVGVREGDGEFIAADLARSLLRLPIREADSELAVDVDTEDLDDATEEHLFLTSSEAADRQQKRFSRNVEQIDTFVQDRVLLLEQNRLDAVAALATAEQARDRAVGAEARTKAERTLKRRETALEDIEAELGRLQRRDDPEYEQFMAAANARRSRPPKVEVLCDINFEVVGRDDA